MRSRRRKPRRLEPRIRTNRSTQKCIVGILLTAGESARMGKPKALLAWRRTTFSKSILQSLQRGGVHPVYVVVGHDPGPIVSHLCELGVRFVYNANWPKGQLSSIQAAIRACQNFSSGILVALVDQPGLNAVTVRRLARQHLRLPEKILVAACRGRPGHPVVFPRRFYRELLAAPLAKGARVVVQKHLSDRVLVDSADPAVLRDVDTKLQYRSLTCS